MFERLRVRVHRVAIEVDGETVEVYIKELPFSVVAQNYEQTDQGELMLRLIAASLCDEQGRPLFSSEEEGVQELRQWRFKPVNELANKIIEINKLQPDPWKSTNHG